MAQSESVSRRFLEQMMLRFVGLGVPIEQAAHELVEIESHIDSSRNDPFEEFGDPQAFASSLVPYEQRLSLYRDKLRTDFTLGLIAAAVMFFAIQSFLSLIGGAVTSVPRLLIQFTLVSLWGVGQASFASILMGVSDDDSSHRIRGMALGCLVAFIAVFAFSGVLSLAGADFSGREPFELSTPVWFGLFGICLLYTSPSPRDQRGSRMPSSA